MKFRPHIPKIFKKKKNYKYELLALALFTAVTWVYFFKWWESSLFLLIAVMLGIYMAMNLWANDVANNMGPAVWSKALSLTWAIIIAAIFEASWALIAGWDVVNTINEMNNWSKCNMRPLNLYLHYDVNALLSRNLD